MWQEILEFGVGSANMAKCYIGHSSFGRMILQSIAGKYGTGVDDGLVMNNVCKGREKQ